MNSFQKKLLKASSGLGFCLATSLVFSGTEAKANSCESLFGSNPSSINNSCYITPETYRITVYEMGLCTSDPLAGTSINSSDDVVTDNTIDESTCTATFQSSTGSQVNLGGGATATLSGTNFRPASGTYPHAYIKIKNTFGLKGSYQLAGTNYYSMASGAKTQNSSLNAEWDEDLMDFNNGATCGSNPELAGAEVFTTGITGTMKAVVAQVSSGTYVGDSSCGSSTRLFGSFAPTTPVTIKDTTQGLEVTFSITNRGMTIIPDGSGGMQGFAGGPFSPSFETY
ncbi:hypothetical protein [Prochlorococcus marinus]|uniref:hypothetical protein n=1 Tax=Prochlorococcus marinus TaxID=1219 RepID=UPI0022B4338F|nr:hypothetical protein [Prochlorococcus marinus]